MVHIVIFRLKCLSRLNWILSIYAKTLLLIFSFKRICRGFAGLCLFVLDKKFNAEQL